MNFSDMQTKFERNRKRLKLLLWMVWWTLFLSSILKD